jgi:hypothetical protein
VQPAHHIQTVPYVSLLSAGVVFSTPADKKKNSLTRTTRTRSFWIIHEDFGCSYAYLVPGTWYSATQNLVLLRTYLFDVNSEVTKLRNFLILTFLIFPDSNAQNVVLVTARIFVLNSLKLAPWL